MAPDASPQPAAEGPRNEVGYAVGHLLASRQNNAWLGIYGAGMFIGLMLIVWMFARWVLEVIGLGSHSRLLNWALLGVALLAAIHWKDALPRAVDGSTVRVMTQTDDGRRVWCVWSKWRLQRLAKLGPIVDEPFEPEIVAAPFAYPRSTRMDVAWILAAAASFGVLYLIIDLFGGVSFPKFHFVNFCSAFAIGWFVIAAALPTTLRIVPGRIDVMSGWFYSTDRAVVRSIVLRDRRVVVDIRTGIVFVLGPARDEQQELLALYGPARLKARIAHTILRAAISTAKPAPLPENEVVG